MQNGAKKPLLSVVVTAFNEELNIRPLLNAIFQALQNIDYELIIVDDGSIDNTVSEIKKNGNDKTKLVVFNRNYGQTTALAAGLDLAQGEYIATMDGDLQNDPIDIPIMLQKAQTEEWDVVAGKRMNRKDGVLWRKIPSNVANWVIRNTTKVYLSDYGCTLRVYKAEIAQNLGLYGELHRFIPILAQQKGARMTEVPVTHHARIHGKSKYGINRTLKVLVDLILMLFFQKYFTKPIHLFGSLGLIAFVIGLLINLYLLVIKLLGNDIWGRPLLLLGFILIIGGLQLITTGIVSEVIIRTYFESQQKKTYNVKSVFHCEKKPV